ncbi:MAG: glutamate--tRNA ligase [Candidatus Pacebacteria bacterium]|nr:glutamate--tRNA ligase [Candidatus Paceibacterota bacterium]
MNNSQDKIVVRYPPSPTGNLHIGNIRSLLFNYLFAKHNSGEIYMRFENTDKERSDIKYEQVALNTLKALGITYDHGPYRQSERGDLYTKAIEQLIESGDAYVAEESKDDSDSNIIRFKNPNKTVTFIDAIRGEISIDTTDFGDFVIARSINNPLYHLTVVVDDIEMHISHIIRGEDHITSTPRQILLIEALGGPTPKYAHLPLIVGSDKKKLGKRHGAVTYKEFAKLGYLPEAVINYLALLGWNAGDNREFFTLDELIKEFTLDGVHKAPAMFSYEKLDSINKHYILQLTEQASEEFILKYTTDDVNKFLVNVSDSVKNKIIHGIIKERISKWGDIQDACANDLIWLEGIKKLDIGKVVWKKSTSKETKKHLETIIELLINVKETDWDEERIMSAIWTYAEEGGKGDVLWPMRYSITGQERSPDPFTVAFILGKVETLKRLQSTLKLL